MHDLQTSLHQKGGIEPNFLTGGGFMGDLIRAKDWSATALGPMETWSPSLRMMVSFLLANRFPLLLWWGPQYVSIYNDAYRPILGNKHPNALGQPVSECWSEIWHILQPLIDTPFNGGPSTWMEDLTVEINRHGFVEETHFTVAYSPVPDETAPRGIGGVLATVHEITEKVIGERRIRVLNDLGLRVTDGKTAETACAIAAEALGNHPKDIPFALLYLLDPKERQMHLAGATGVAIGSELSPVRVDVSGDGLSQDPWRLAEALRSETAVLVDDIEQRFTQLPPGPWSDHPREAVVIPIRSTKAHQLAGLLVAGVSARLRLDHLYLSFLDLVAAQIATAIANARSYEEERKRAAALAEIDHAKTVFFSNVSHEFRTPLTLMLGPLEDLLNDPALLGAEQRQQLDVAHRNSLRLLRLVNTLLDFSRIEAGRVQASYQPTDLAALTADLASQFRSATERAGITLKIECPPLREPVYVDRDMWEKLVLNLLSNAFKFTFDGSITIALRADDDNAELRIRDTGIGISPHELPRLFERFHRVEGSRGRTHEGTGIGLALVQELARLHGGTVRVDSTPGVGSTFSVSIPFGTAHLPSENVQSDRSLVSTAIGSRPFVEEALRWLPAETSSQTTGTQQSDLDQTMASGSCASGGSILLADDNADMRDYVARLLAPHYEVRTVADGSQALNEIQKRRPDLVLSDVMMPRLDGLGLVRAVRADRALADLPIMLLSARAGEDESVQGLEAGADDYLVKPFSARELLARVAGTLKLARIRQEFEARIAADQAQARLAHSQRMEALGQLAGGIAHDFNNVLQAVSGGLTLIEKRAQEPQLRRLANMAGEAAARGSAITGRLLSFARRGELRATSVEPLPLLENLREMLIPTLGTAITIRSEVSPDTPPLLADKAQLETVLVNLAINARDAMPDGGTLTMSVVPERVDRANGKSPGSYVRIQVIDTGKGMDAATLARASEPFFTTKPPSQGTGLGLAMARGFAQQSGGDFHIESAPGLGTTVSLWFPEADQAKAAVLPDPRTLPGSVSARVLVADDDPMVREVLAWQLVAQGYRVTQASDGLAALAELESGNIPDLLVTDFAMPGMNGLTLIQEARRRRLGLPALLLTGYADRNIVDDIHSMQLDPISLLRKPVSDAELLERTAAMLSAAS
jgi:signal transduction histidine kinase